METGSLRIQKIVFNTTFLKSGLSKVKQEKKNLGQKEKITKFDWKLWI